MSKVFKGLVLVLITLFSFPAYSYSKVVEIDGKKGIFFDEETVTQMLEDLEEFHILKNEKIPELNLIIDKQKYELQLKDKEIAVLDKIILRKDQAATLLEEQNASLLLSLSKEKAFYKSAGFNFVLGFLAGGVVAVGLSFGLSK